MKKLLASIPILLTGCVPNIEPGIYGYDYSTNSSSYSIEVEGDKIYLYSYKTTPEAPRTEALCEIGSFQRKGARTYVEEGAIAIALLPTGEIRQLDMDPTYVGIQVGYSIGGLVLSLQDINPDLEGNLKLAFSPIESIPDLCNGRNPI